MNQFCTRRVTRHWRGNGRQGWCTAEPATGYEVQSCQHLASRSSSSFALFGIIAAGFKRYGFAKEAKQIARALLDAAERFQSYRLPEVFAGTWRRGQKTNFPQLYPGRANIPQTWASGSFFHLIQTLLGLRADAPHQRLYVHPTLPDWLPEIDLQQLRVGSCLIDLHFWREGDRSCWKVRTLQADPNTPQDAMIQVMDDAKERSLIERVP